MRNSLRSYLFTLLLGLIAPLALSAQEAPTFKTPSFPVPFGPENVGTEFYMSFPANLEEGTPAERYIRLYISSGVTTKVDIYALGGYKGSINTKANEIVTFDLNKNEAQIFERRAETSIPDDQVYKNMAVRVVAQDPIIVYGINRASQTSDGFLALPVNALGQEYVVASAANNIPFGGGLDFPSQFMVIAPYDNTNVTITFPMDTKGHVAGQRITVPMMKGDVYSAMSTGFKGDMTGAVIRSNNPVAVTAGQNCTFLPDENYWACDHIVEMLTPTDSWGKIYFALPIQERTKGDTYRVIAGEPNARVFVNGNEIATINQVGGENGFGWIEFREEVRHPMIFTSDKRISVAQYNNGQRYDNSTSTDPFFMILTPVEQFQQAVIFTTPNFDFTKNYINMIADSAGMATAEMTKAGEENWQKVNTLPGVAIATMPPSPDGKKYVGATFPIPPGAYRLRSSAGSFAAYIYGGGLFDSYGYPLSIATGNLVLPDTVAPEIVGDPECNGSVEGTITDFPDDATIRSNLSTIRLHPSSLNYLLTHDPFTPRVSRSAGYRLRVVNPLADGIAILVATDQASNVSYDTVRYFARNISITPDPLDIGEVLVGTTATRQVTITNNGNRAIEIVRLFLKNGTTGFDIVSPTGGFILNPGVPVQATIRLSGTTPGPFTDSLGFEDTCGTFVVTQVKGTVVQPIISVSDINFNTLPVSNSLDRAMTITNVGTGTLRVTGRNAGPFDPVYTLPNGLPAFPADLRPGEFRTFNVRFTPTAVRQYPDSIIFDHNAPPSSANDPVGLILGEGIEATLFATSYDWGRKRVGSGPHPARVEIRNLGSADARVQGIKAQIGDAASFTINSAQVVNLTIQPGQIVPVDVTFTPQRRGPQQLKIIFDTDLTADEAADTTVFSILEGVGTEPGLATSDLDFGQLDLGDPEVSLPVDFFLEGPDNIYIDSVTITDFRFVTDNNGAGVDDFRYELPAGVTLPVILRPGEPPLTITGYFRPTAAGTRNAALTALTNDGVDTTSFWVGRALSQNSAISATATAGDTLCLGESDTIMLTIESNGVLPLTISDLRIVDPRGEFTLLSNPGTPFSIQPQQSEIVMILFTPQGTNGPRGAAVTITSDDPNTPVVSVPLSGAGSSYTITGQLELEGTFIDDNEASLAVLGEEITARLTINEPIAGALLTDYRATITYEPSDLFGPTSVAQIEIDPLVHPIGTSVTIDPSSTRGRLVLDVSSPTPIAAGADATLLTMPFGVVFNTVPSRTIDATVEFTGGASCASIAVTGDSIGVNPVCGLNLRMIELIGGGKYALVGATPNPATDGMADIDYSLGLDGPTRVTLHDASGNLVATIVDQYQQPGGYRVSIDVTGLPSGAYFCRLVSGHFSETKRMMIAK